MGKNRFKYVCEDCGKICFFTAGERTSAFGMICNGCGSRHLELSKCSKGKKRLPHFHDLKQQRNEMIKQKMNIK